MDEKQQNDKLQLSEQELDQLVNQMVDIIDRLKPGSEFTVSQIAGQVIAKSYTLDLFFRLKSRLDKRGIEIRSAHPGAITGLPEFISNIKL